MAILIPNLITVDYHHFYLCHHHQEQRLLPVVSSLSRDRFEGNMLECHSNDVNDATYYDIY